MIVGKKNSGKSHLCCKLLLTEWKNVYDEIIFISPTFKAQFDKLWCKLKSDGITVYEAVNETLLLNILMKVTKKEKEVLLIFDDVGTQLRLVREHILNLLICNSRHYRLSIVSLHQRLTQAPPTLRGNADTTIMFSANSYLELDHLWKMTSTVPRNVFNKRFREATKGAFSFMVSTINNEGQLKFYRDDLKTEIHM